jgi:hypothetical protein
MIVALTASSAFMTPVSSRVNTVVVGPGNDTFVDFVRVGVPFTLIALIVSVALVPWLLPFLTQAAFRRQRTRTSQREPPSLTRYPAGFQRRLGSRAPCREICRARTAEVNIWSLTGRREKLIRIGIERFRPAPLPASGARHGRRGAG